jgi:predicted RNA-binding protein with PUA-like domain
MFRQSSLICFQTKSLQPSTGTPLQSARMNYWLVKSEPESYSWETFVKEKRAAWTGVRNFQARNNLRAMKRGDFAFFYHSVSGKQIVGVARVEKEAYADPTAKEGDWSCVDLVPEKALKQPVTLDQIKSDKTLSGMPLVRLSRISVTPVTEAQFKRVLALGGTEL